MPYTPGRYMALTKEIERCDRAILREQILTARIMEAARKAKRRTKRKGK